MKAIVTGQIVDLETFPWNMNGKTGIAYGAFVALGNPRDGAQRIRVEPVQYGALAVGDIVEWPVIVRAQVNDYGTAKLQVTLDPEFAPDLGGAKEKVGAH